MNSEVENKRIAMKNHENLYIKFQTVRTKLDRPKTSLFDFYINLKHLSMVLYSLSTLFAEKGTKNYSI